MAGVDSPIWQQDAAQRGLTLPGDLSAANGTFTGNLAVTGTVTAGATTAGALRSATVSASGAINTTETLLGNLAIIPASGTLAAGSIIECVLHGTCVSTNADVSTFRLRAGTLGTKADALLSGTTLQVTAATGTAAFEVSIRMVVQTLGAGGTGFGSMRVLNTGVVGLSNAAVTVVPFTTALLATTTATFIDICYVSAAVTTTCTFQDVTVEVKP